MNTTPNTEQKTLAETIEAESQGHRGRRWIVGAAVLALATAGIWIVQAGQKNGKGPAYATSPVERGDLAIAVTATGNLEPTNEVTVGSELSGTALEVLVETNDRVAKGQALAKLDTRKFAQQTASSRAALAAAEAQVAQVEATVAEKDAALGRARDLHKVSGGKMPSKADMDSAVAEASRAKADLASANAAVDEARAQLQSNETDLEKATIVAPIDGVVLARDLEPGQTVAASFNTPELFVIAEKLERMKLKVSVAEADIGGVKEGQTASFTVDAWPDRSYSAKVLKAAYGSTVTDNVVTYETELEVANDDLSLRPGMTATVDIQTSEARGALLVPSAALRFDPASAAKQAQPAGAPKKSFLQSIVPGPPRGGAKRPAEGQEAPARKKAGESRVWVLENGEPRAIPVRTGLGNGRVTEVSGEGLKEGMAVIVRAASPAQP